MDIRKNVSQNMDIIAQGRKTIDWAKERKRKKDQLLAESEQEARRVANEKCARRTQGEGTWLSHNAEREDIDAVFDSTRWSEVLRETRGDAWAMTTWHAQRDWKPPVDVPKLRSPALNSMSMTMRLWPSETMHCNPFV